MVVDTTPSYVMVSCNERGFCARDVRALCRLALSEKQAGKHTGQKGLGFKSVFSCSDRPAIVSKVRLGDAFAVNVSKQTMSGRIGASAFVATFPTAMRCRL